MNIMLMEKSDKLTELLSDPSLSEGEREYFEKQKKPLSDTLRNF